MYFHKQIFKTADVIVSPMTGYLAASSVVERLLLISLAHSTIHL